MCVLQRTVYNSMFWFLKWKDVKRTCHLWWSKQTAIWFLAALLDLLILLFHFKIVSIIFWWDKTLLLSNNNFFPLLSLYLKFLHKCTMIIKEINFSNQNKLQLDYPKVKQWFLKPQFIRMVQNFFFKNTWKQKYEAIALNYFSLQDN